jgi:hypothetical protein
VNYTEILEALREFTSRERIEFLPLALDAKPISDYGPIEKYVLDLKNGAKPESAAEDLFTALCKDVLSFQPTRQVGSGEGWVDFMLPDGDKGLGAADIAVRHPIQTLVVPEVRPLQLVPSLEARIVPESPTSTN